MTNLGEKAKQVKEGRVILYIIHIMLRLLVLVKATIIIL